MSVEQELETLAKTLNKANEEYYNYDTPSLSDAEYDSLKDRNTELEEVYPQYKRDDSPSNQVGAPLSGRLPKIKHAEPMYSLAKTHTEDGVYAFDKSVRKLLGMES
ncbi:MAG: hypothetical protein JKY50_00210 [Oleispira sp.]|nr:hypothetical protein [Oleispira sp.]